MRHGQSRANASGIIVSSIERDAAGDFGLTGLGRDQAAAAVRGCGLPASTLICCSDFARAAADSADRGGRPRRGAGRQHARAARAVLR